MSDVVVCTCEACGAKYRAVSLKGNTPTGWLCIECGARNQ